MRSVTLWLIVAAFSAIAQGPPDFPNQLFQAPDDAARESLLAGRKDLLDAKLLAEMNEMAGKVYDSREYERALRMYGVVCGLADRAGDRKALGVCTFGKGLSLGRLFRLDEALGQYQEADRLYQAMNDLEGDVTVLNAAAVLLHRRNDMALALPYLERAMQYAERTASEFGIAQTSTNLGNLYKAQGKYTQAIQVLQRALEITRKRGLERQSSWIMNNLGSVYYEQRDLDLALDYHQRSLTIKEKGGDPADLASSSINVGTIYQSLREYGKAMPYFERALELSETAKLLPTKALALYNLGETLRQEGRLREATERLQAALEVADRIANRSLSANAKITIAQIDVDEGRPRKAADAVDPLIESSRERGDVFTLIRGLDVAGMARHRLGMHAEAEAALEEGIRLTEELREQLPGDRQGVSTFLEDNRSLYSHMVRLQADRQRAESALAYADRLKSRALLDMLRGGRVNLSKALTKEEQGREAELSRTISQTVEQQQEESRRPAPDPKRVTQLSSQLQRARVAYRVFEVQLYTAHPQLKAQRVAFQPVTPAELVAGLPDRQTAFLEYSLLDSGGFLFVVTRGETGAVVKQYRLDVDRETLTRDVQRFRRQIATRDLDYRRLATSLFRHLLEPARAQLQGKTALVIVPDGVLWQLPFQALGSGADRHLLQDHAIFYAPSLSVLHEVRKLRRGGRRPGTRVLAIDAMGEASSRREVAGLREVYGAANVRIAPGLEDESNYDVLHIAAHGVFHDKSPMSSYLSLANGPMEARQLMDLDLRAGMAVLSGCETGVGGGGASEGLVGMSWALFVAGSPTTVASQWRVPAASTGELMLGFHRGLQRLPKAKALQQSALQVMRNPAYRHPFYWAGFVLVGDGF